MIDDARAQALKAAIRRPAVLATIGTLSLALVLGGLVWSTGRPAATTSPGSTADPSQGWQSLAPSATAGPVSASTVPLLSAKGSQGGVVPLETGFRLESVDATPASQLAAALTVEPAFDFAIELEAGDRAAVITPAEPLQPGFVYRFDLHGATGELLETWAFQASQPVRVVATLPDDQSSDVPLDTGIEVTFDQDGIVDAASHVTISPVVDGRFEQHERTIVFVPDRPLKAATIYSVEVSRGVTVEQTGEASVADTRFRFETTATAANDDPLFDLQGELFESAVADRPVVGLWYREPEDVKAPTTTPIEVYRLAGLEAGIDAFRTIRARPDWSRWSTEGIVDTSGLDRVVFVKGRLLPSRGAFVVRLPEALAAGWYLVQLPHGKRPDQAVLQVTDVAGYLSISETQTVVWANDLASGRPVAGATVTADGASIDRTDAEGLAMGATPSVLIPDPRRACASPCDPVVTIAGADGRAIFLPATSSHDKLEAFGDTYYWSGTDRTHWALLHTDRLRYRPIDTVNLWGVIRRRDDGVVPATVTLELTAESFEDDAIRPPTAILTVTPGRAGAFTGSLALAGVAEGRYALRLVVDGATVRTTYLTVGPIVKPAYRLEILTGRRVYIADDRIRVDVQASFFEGTPVPGVPLRIEGYVERAVTTDAVGHAIHRTTAVTDLRQEGPEMQSVSVSPARAEEGEISGASREFLVFPSSRTIAADATIEGGRVKVTGDVHLVDVDRLEAAIADGTPIWDLDARGAPVRGVTVTIAFTELIPVRTRIGTEYDFIEKKVVPVYQSETIERSRGDLQVKTAADGTYDASIAASATNNDYRVHAWVGDPDGNRANSTAWASRLPWDDDDLGDGAILTTTADGTDSYGEFGVGDPIDLTMTDTGHRQANGDGTRYLFIEAQSGIRSATVQPSRRYRSTFEAWAPPNLDVNAIRFTGDEYVTAAFDVRFRTSDRHLSVDLAVAAERYAPGDTATVSIRTRDADGKGTPATIILRAVDEKLFVMGAAAEDDPLAELYATLPSGVTGGYTSHRAPTSDTSGGDTTGGGGGDERIDFRDVVLFRSVDTDVNGRGSVSFEVSDDLTSWRVSASAITADLDAGYGSVLVPVGLPFFVDASLARQYLLADRPSIPVRVFGTAVEPGDAATVRVTAPGLGFDSGPLPATTFETTLVPLPALKAGPQTITFTATTGSGASARTDRLTRTFDVVSTRLTTTKTAYVSLPGASAFQGGPGLTRVVVSDAGSGRYLSLLEELAAGGGARLDRGIAADMAADLLSSGFGIPSERDSADRVSASTYQGGNGSLTLMPYSSGDLGLSSLVALLAPDHVDRAQLTNYLRFIRSAVGETRERQTFALAGLAGLGEPVLPAIRAAASDPALTVRERLMIGIGAARLGDAGTARTVATSLRDEYGEQAASVARLRVGSSAADITQATALMGVLASAIGDPLAPDYQAYVEANPAADQLHVLEAAAFVTDTLARLPVQPVSVRYTVDGETTTVELGAGRALELSLDADQLAALRIEPVTGTVGVATSWAEPVRAADLTPDPEVTIKRAVSPADPVDEADLIKVSLTVTFGPQAATGCHQVTELVPSGLTPVGPSAAWVGDEEDQPFQGVVLPYDTSGPRVYFCAEPTKEDRTIILRYYARVVTPGTYAWEPAVAPSRSQADMAARSRAGTITIR